MHIMINALAVKVGGGFTYIINLIDNLGKIDKDNQYTIITSKKLKLEPNYPNIRQLVVNINSVPLRFFFEQFILPFYIKRLKVDVLYSPHDMTTLLAPCKIVLAMRNPCLYTKTKQEWGFKDRLRIKILSQMAKLSALRADLILFVSNDSKDWISSNLGLEPSKLRVVHHGINLNTKIIKNNIDKNEPYILSVSTIYHYKNFIRLIEAYAYLISHKNVKENLIIIGEPIDKPYYIRMKKTIVSLKLEERVKFLGHVPYRDIFKYYQNASLFVFPSYLETFGHPILEAMAMGVPLVAADINVFREIAGDAAQYFNPYDVYEMAEAINKVLSNPILQAEMVSKGLARVKEFTWEKTAEKTLKIFKELCSVDKAKELC